MQCALNVHVAKLTGEVPFRNGTQAQKFLAEILSQKNRPKNFSRSRQILNIGALRSSHVSSEVAYTCCQVEALFMNKAPSDFYALLSVSRDVSSFNFNCVILAKNSYLIL